MTAAPASVGASSGGPAAGGPGAGGAGADGAGAGGAGADGAGAGGPGAGGAGAGGPGTGDHGADGPGAEGRWGRFVTVEGVDGAGKTTQLRRLAEALRAAGHEVVATREPGGAPGAEEIRRLLVEGAPGRWSPEAEALLFTAARRDHLDRTVLPALARGAVVLCDRYVDSTRAYQAAARGAARALVDGLHRLAIGLDPDLTLILDLDPDAAARRSAAAKGAETRFERFGPRFQHDLRAAFRAIAAAEPDRCAVIDADADPDAVAARLRAAVAARLGL